MALDYTIIEPSESDIQKAILDYLRLKYFCWRNNTGGRPWQDNKGKDRVFRFGFKGSGDILGLTKTGRFFSVEVKRKGKKPTPDQIEFMNNINASGGLAIVAQSVDDVLKSGL